MQNTFMTLNNLDTVIAFAVVMLLLSLLVTALVQAVIATLGLRGSNLVDGVSRLLRQADPAFDKQIAKEISKKVLKHPSVAQTFRRATTAISKDELIKLLNDVAGHPPPGLSPTAVKHLKDYLAKGVPGIGAMQQAIVDIDRWFDAVMIRNTERFVARTRLVTVIIAVIAAGGLHVDALRIFNQLRTNDEVRMRLVQGLDNWQKQAEGILGKVPVGTSAVQATIGELSLTTLPQIPADLVTQSQGESWLQKTLPRAEFEKAAVVYRKHYANESQKTRDEYLEAGQHVKTELANLPLTIVPMPLPGFDYFDWIRMDNEKDTGQIAAAKLHLLGTLITILLLSLGAPFWFNTLRNLATLRPMVAQRLDPK
jgi:hypothetical protein